MSEPMGCQVEVGGELPAELIVELIGAVQDDIYECVGPDDEQQFRDELKQHKKPSTIMWEGTSNYGECDTVKAFCHEHNLAYMHHCDAKYEYDASLEYWIPGMKEPIKTVSDNDHKVTITADKIRPLLDLLLDYAKNGCKNFPLYIYKDQYDSKLIEKCIKHPEKTVEYIEKKINVLLPTIPTLPPLSIKE